VYSSIEASSAPRSHRAVPRLCGRLRAGEIIGPVGVQDLPVPADLIHKIVDHRPGEAHPVVVQKSERDEIAVPPVHLVEPPAGNDKGNPFESAGRRGPQGEREETVASVKRPDVLRRDPVRETDDAHVQLRVGRGIRREIAERGRIRARDVDVPPPVGRGRLVIPEHCGQPGRIHVPRETVPEVHPDHPADPIGRRLEYLPRLQHRNRASLLLREGQLLEEIGKVVCPRHFIAPAPGRCQPEPLVPPWSAPLVRVIDGDLPVVVGIFVLYERIERLLYPHTDRLARPLRLRGGSQAGRPGKEEEHTVTACDAVRHRCLSLYSQVPSSKLHKHSDATGER